MACASDMASGALFQDLCVNHWKENFSLGTTLGRRELETPDDAEWSSLERWARGPET